MITPNKSFEISALSEEDLETPYGFYKSEEQ